MTNHRYISALSIAIAVFAFAASNAIAFQSVESKETENTRENLQGKLQQLEKSQREYTDSIKRLTKDKAEDMQQLELLEEKTGGLSEDSYASVVASLQSRRVELMIDLTGIDARRSAIEAIVKTATDGASVDSVLIGQLEKMVEVQKKSLSELTALYQSGAASSKQLRDAELKILELEIQLAREKQKPNQASLFDSQLVDLSLDRAEKKAKLEHIEQMLAKFAKSREALGEKSRLEASISSLYKNISAWQRSLEQNEKQIQQIKSQIGELQNDR
jgi:chromosome segregation ATPase